MTAWDALSASYVQQMVADATMDPQKMILRRDALGDSRRRETFAVCVDIAPSKYSPNGCEFERPAAPVMRSSAGRAFRSGGFDWYVWYEPLPLPLTRSWIPLYGSFGEGDPPVLTHVAKFRSGHESNDRSLATFSYRGYWMLSLARPSFYVLTPGWGDTLFAFFRPDSDTPLFVERVTRPGTQDQDHWVYFDRAHAHFAVYGSTSGGGFSGDKPYAYMRSLRNGQITSPPMVFATIHAWKQFAGRSHFERLPITFAPR
jgi:hypothetical protein